MSEIRLFTRPVGENKDKDKLVCEIKALIDILQREIMLVAWQQCQDVSSFIEFSDDTLKDQMTSKIIYSN